MYSVINLLFGNPFLFRMFGSNRLLISLWGKNLDNQSININDKYNPAWFEGNNTELNSYVEDYGFTHWGDRSKINLYKRGQGITLFGGNGVITMAAENQFAYINGVGNAVHQQSSNAQIIVSGFSKSSKNIINLNGWNSSVTVNSGGNVINMGTGGGCRALVDSDFNVVNAKGGDASVYINGSNNISNLSGRVGRIELDGNNNTANLNGTVLEAAKINGLGNVVNIKTPGVSANVHGSRNITNLYDRNQVVNVYGAMNIVNLHGAGEVANIFHLHGSVNIFNVNNVNLRGSSFAKISIGSTACYIDVSSLRSGAIYQVQGSRNVIAGNDDRRISVINTSLAYFTSTLASLGPPVLPSGANISISASALGMQTAITVGT